MRVVSQIQKDEQRKLWHSRGFFMVTGLTFVLTGLLYAVLFAELIARYPCNHAGGTGMYWWGLVLMVVVNAGTMVWWRRIAWWRVLLLVVFGVLLMVCDRCNILVDYDTWTSRGMPDWGELSS